tara:strand:+ start:524 stop:1285 length:762 start_codon:yes stop_codon:yes gene_type:complete
MKVYWGITASRSYRNTIPHDQAVMLSACGLWKGRGRFQKKRLDWADWFLDSGGFTALNKWGDYPFSPDEYLALVERDNPSWAASMDYPCEPDISRQSQLSNDDRIVATVQLAKYLTKRDNRIIPVIQGYEIDEFAECIRLMRRAAVPLGRVAIGSVCRRQRTKEIARLAWDLRLLLPQSSIHGFGVKISALHHPAVRACFNSIDTNAWEWWIRGRKMDGLSDLTDKEGFAAYRRRLEDIRAQDRQLALTEVLV